MALWADRLAKLAQALATAGTVPDTSISTAETDVDLRLAPDGAGGVEWGTGGAAAFVGVRVTHSTTQSITNAGTFVALLFDTEQFDSDAFHSIVTNTERLTVPSGRGGKYAIGCVAGLAANATGGRQLRIRLNGTTDIAAVGEIPGATTLSWRDALSTIYDLAVGDYVEVMVAHTGSAALNTVAADGLPQFWMHKLD